jgi:1-deoxy-D-xylulose-5-phosphate synthase
MAPSDENEARQMLHTAYLHEGPAAVRYPRGVGPGVPVQEELSPLPIGKSRKVRDGEHMAILAFGPTVHSAKTVAERLNATLIDMRFVKPIDEDAILAAAEQHQALVTIEENAVMGGAGSAVLECLAKHQLMRPVLNLGLPDRFVEHGDPGDLLSRLELDEEGLQRRIQAFQASLSRRSQI